MSQQEASTGEIGKTRMLHMCWPLSVVMKWTRPLCGSAAMRQNDFKTSEIYGATGGESHAEA